MTTIVWITAGVTIGIISPWIIMRWCRSAAGSVLPSTASGQGQITTASDQGQINEEMLVADSWQAVTIRPSLESCAAAIEQRGRRYLATEAPDLPLPGCDVTKCGCRFKNHEDRRDDEDRRLEFGQFNNLNPRSGNEDRRLTGDRERRHREEEAEPSAYFNSH